MVVPFGNMNLNVQIHADANITLHDVVERSVVESANFHVNKLAGKKTLEQRKRSAPTMVRSSSELSAGDLSCGSGE